MRRFISMALILSFLLACIPPFGEIVGHSAVYDDMLLDFTNPKVILDFGFVEASVDSSATAKWVFKNSEGKQNFSYLHENGLPTDWRVYTSLKLKLYSPSSYNDKMSILLSSGSATSEGYYLATIELNWTGWNEVTVPFTSFAKKNGTATVGDYWGDIKGIGLWRGDWINQWTQTDTELYIESIKLSGKTGAIAPKSDLTAGDFYCGSDGFSSVSDNSSNTRMYLNNAKWSDMENNERMVKSYDAPIDAGGQKYFNIWAYSEKANNADVHIVLYSDGIKSKNNNGIAEGWYINTVKIDWTGWKLLSIPIKNFNRKNAPNLTGIKRIEFDSRVWNSGNSGPLSDTVLCFDKIWFGEAPLSEFSSSPSSSVAENASVNINIGFVELEYEEMLFPYTVMDNYMVKKIADYVKLYKDTNEINTYTVSADGKKLKITFSEDLTPSSQYKITVDSGLYNACTMATTAGFELNFRAKSSGVDDYIILEPITESDCRVGPLLPSTEQTKNYSYSAKWENTKTNGVVTMFSGGATNFSDYSYLNFWAYSQKATGSILNVILFTEGSNKYFNYKRNIDWTGWKLISIDLAKYDKIKNSPDMSKLVEIDFDARVWHSGDAEPSDDTKLYFDKVWMSTTGYSELEPSGDVSPVYYDDFLPVGGEGKLYFNNPIDPSTVSDAVQCSIPADITADLNAVKITPRNHLSFNSSFEVNINNKLKDIYGDNIDEAISKTFYVGVKDMWSTIPVFSHANIASATVYNPTTSRKNAVMLVGSELVAETLEPGESKTLTSTARPDGTKAVVIDADTGKPLHSSYAYTSDFNVNPLSGSEKSVLCIDEAIITGDEFKLKVHITGKAPRTIVATLTDKTGKKLYYAENVESSAEWTTDVSCLGSGLVNVSIYGRSCEGGKVFGTYYADDTTKAQVLSAVRANPKAGLTAYGDILELSADIDFIADTLLEQNPYSSYDYLKSQIALYTELLNKIKTCTWSGLFDILNNNSSVILYNCAAWSKYNTYSTDNKNAVLTDVVDKSYSSFKEFRTAFNESVEKYSGTNLVNDPDNYDSKNDNYQSGGSVSIGNSGGGGASTGPFVGQNPGDVSNPAGGEKYFTDTDSVVWASDAIHSLLDAGVISASPDRRFRPEDNITREEYLKMLLVALGLYGDSASCDFTDVSKDAWYYDYVALAYRLGISLGKGDGSFGISEHISRQDMAVLALRAMSAAGIKTSGEKLSFADHNDISQYALDSVSLLAGEGIINGIGEGIFNPLGTATRAEGAKIIYAIRNLR